jgi:peroxiredoxin
MTTIAGYTMGQASIPKAPIAWAEFEELKKSVLFGEEDVKYLRMAGEVLVPKVEELLDDWYGFVGSNPHLVKSFAQKSDGKPDEGYLGAVAQALRSVGQGHLRRELRPEVARLPVRDRPPSSPQRQEQDRRRARRGERADAAHHRAHRAHHAHGEALPREERTAGRGRREDARRVVQGGDAPGRALVLALRGEGRLLMLGVPRPAPEWRTTRWFNTDAPLSLARLRGQVVVLHAFQMLCPGCVTRGIPQAQRAAELFAGAPVTVVGLHTVFEHHDVMTPAALEVFLHEYRIRFPVGVDEPGEDGDPIPRTMRAYALRGTPSTVLIDAEGRIRQQVFGTHDDLVLGAQIGLLVAEADGSSSGAPERRTAEPGCSETGCTPGS